MMLGLILLLALASIFLIIFLPSWRQRRILRQPFPSGWETILAQRLPFLARLDPAEARQLRALIKLFMAGKIFYGCGGLELDDEIRVTIAAQACLLLLNRNTALYPRLRHILVYPEAFWTGHPRINEDGTLSGDGEGLLGESWDEGKVILSWDDVEYGAADFEDGHNVVLHEFAHQLDGETGETDGAPVLSRARARSWWRVLRREFETLGEDWDAGRETFLDPYGATNLAEFFAVVTECFYEQPRELARLHPELFRELRGYYRVDPRKWHSR